METAFAARRSGSDFVEVVDGLETVDALPNTRFRDGILARKARGGPAERCRRLLLNEWRRAPAPTASDTCCTSGVITMRARPRFAFARSMLPSTVARESVSRIDGIELPGAAAS